MEASSIPGKVVRDEFFVPCEGIEGLWECKCGTKRKQSGTSYTNLVAHVKTEHPDDYKRMADEPSSNQISSADSITGPSFFFKKKVRQIHCWLDIIINELQPFSIVENAAFIRNVQYPPISRPSVSKYLVALTAHVESKIRSQLPDRIALVFDGWSSNDTHFVAVYATYSSESELGYNSVLLAFSPFEDESSQDAIHHLDFTKWVLSNYGKSFANVIALIGDNCATNRRFATLAKTNFVGCASHRFNLAVKDMIEESNDIVQKIHDLMKKLRTPIAAAKLRKLTYLKAKTLNATRWSSCSEMFKRYQELKEFIGKVEIEDIDDLILTTRENRKVDELCAKFQELESVTKYLQSNRCTISDCRLLFNGIIDMFPSTKERLSASADIVHDKDFERALSKIQEGKVNSLTRAERTAAKGLKLGNDDVIEVPQSPTSFSLAAHILKKARPISTNSEYIDTRFIVPTSNMCERLFSKAGYALNDRRKRLSPMNFEWQIFLHANSNLWSLRDVDKLIN